MISAHRDIMVNQIISKCNEIEEKEYKTRLHAKSAPLGIAQEIKI